MDSCDVLIVGGGPAGSSCALGLRGTGLDVRVLDRAEFPRNKVCAGWITPQVTAALGLDLEEYGRERVLQPIRGFRVGMIGRRITEFDCGETVSYGIRRFEFDEYLLRRCGARLHLGEKIRDLGREKGRWLAGEGLAATVLVGAGGHFCPVARHLGARPGRTEPAVLAQEVEFPLDARQRRECPADPERPELYFTADLSGYGWVVRKGDYLNVGLGRQDPGDFPRHMKAFLEYLEAEGRLPPGLPDEFHGHAYLLYDSARRPFAGEGVLLAGDATGLAYTRSGEGIRPAVESGLLAAEAIKDSGCDPKTAPAAYAAAMESHFGKRRGEAAPGWTRLLPAPWRQPLAAAFISNPVFAQKVLVDRWFLHRHHPALSL